MSDCGLSRRSLGTTSHSQTLAPPGSVSNIPHLVRQSNARETVTSAAQPSLGHGMMEQSRLAMQNVSAGESWRPEPPTQLFEARSVIRSEIIERVLTGSIPLVGTNNEEGLLSENQLRTFARRLSSYVAGDAAAARLEDLLCVLKLHVAMDMETPELHGITLETFFTGLADGSLKGPTEGHVIRRGLLFVATHLAKVQSPEYLAAAASQGELRQMYKLLSEAHFEEWESPHHQTAKRRSNGASLLDELDGAVLEEASSSSSTGTPSTEPSDKKPISSSLYMDPAYLQVAITSAAMFTHQAHRAAGVDTPGHASAPQFLLSRLMKCVNIELADLKKELARLSSSSSDISDDNFADNDDSIRMREEELTRIRDRINRLDPSLYVPVWEAFFAFLVTGNTSFSVSERWLDTYVQFARRHRGAVEDLARSFNSAIDSQENYLDSAAAASSIAVFDEAALLFEDLEGIPSDAAAPSHPKDPHPPDHVTAPTKLLSDPLAQHLSVTLTTGGILPIGIAKSMATLVMVTHSFQGGMGLLGKLAKLCRDDVSDFERHRLQFGDRSIRHGAGYVYPPSTKGYSAVMPKPTVADTHHILALVGFSLRFTPNAPDGGFLARTLERIISHHHQPGDKPGEDTHRFLKETTWAQLTFLMPGMSFESALTLIQLKATLVQLELDAGADKLADGEAVVPYFVWLNLLRYASRQYRVEEAEGLLRQILSLWRRQTLAVTDSMGGSDEDDLGLGRSTPSHAGPTLDREEHLLDSGRLYQLQRHVQSVLSDLIIAISYTASMYEPALRDGPVDGPSEKNYAVASDLYANRLQIEAGFHVDALREETLRIHHKHFPNSSPTSNAVIRLKLNYIQRMEERIVNDGLSRLMGFADSHNATSLTFLELTDKGIGGVSGQFRKSTVASHSDDDVGLARSETDAFNNLFGANAAFARLSAEVSDADDYSMLDRGLYVPANKDASVAREQVKGKRDVFEQERRQQEIAQRARIEKAREEDAKQRHERTLSEAKLMAAAQQGPSPKKVTTQAAEGGFKKSDVSGNDRPKGASKTQHRSQLNTSSAKGAMRFSDRHRAASRK